MRLNKWSKKTCENFSSVIDEKIHWESVKFGTNSEQREIASRVSLLTLRTLKSEWLLPKNHFRGAVTNCAIFYRASSSKIDQTKLHFPAHYIDFFFSATYAVRRIKSRMCDIIYYIYTNFEVIDGKHWFLGFFLCFVRCEW